MTWFDYRESQRFGRDPNFYALIMAAMRKADTYNAIRLRRAFPDVWDELRARYLAPGGVVDGDPPWPARSDRLGRGRGVMIYVLVFLLGAVVGIGYAAFVARAERRKPWWRP